MVGGGGVRGVDLVFKLPCAVVSLWAVATERRDDSCHRHNTPSLSEVVGGGGAQPQAPGAFTSFRHNRYVQLEASFWCRRGSRAGTPATRRRARTDGLPAAKRSPMPKGKGAAVSERLPGGTWLRNSF